MSSNQVLEVKIENLHRELNSFKEETKEDIRDINISIKQSEKLFNAAIMTMTENITKLTTIAGQQREEMRQQREESTYPNNCTIGIECNHIDMSGKMTFETYQSLLEFCVPLLKRYNLTENDLRLHKEVVGWKDCHRWFVNNPDE
ncbi:N-acetylmuramoyl-L-alanine amidase [Brevibacillus laterosporus]|uniref:N-acetylmuramoyl-L-alanine amidase n=1 Tax=Brevibacillus laterosporus TaxID=1465 RepID=UPI000EAF74D6|nr:N-acetylmuramoyl-L-alanine amidase [Brevibacillus laterosporus]AYK07637.1 hypothetical protein D8Z77_15375 [Brevibacillus laterosporus]